MKALFNISLIILFAGSLLANGIGSLCAQDQGPTSDDRKQTSSRPAPDQGPEDTQPTQGALPTNVTNPDYLIGPEDVLTLEVFNLPEMKQTVRVENDGTISVRLLGPVRAEGLTSLQLKHELETDWGKHYLEDPQVSIFVKKFKARPVSVVGSVVKPGLYQLPGPRNIIQVLAMAGGLVESSAGGPGAGRYLYISRNAGFDNLEPMDGVDLVAPNKLRVEIKKLLYSEEGPNIQVKPMDLITVPRAGVVYIVGAVMHPQKVILEDRDSMTVMEAVAVAEGLAPNARQSRAKIIRRTSGGHTTEIPLDLGKIFKRKAPDPKLVANDMLLVPNSEGKAAAKTSISAAIGTLSGYLIFHP